MAQPAAWAFRLDRFPEALDPERLQNVRGELGTLVREYNARTVAAMLGVDPAQVSRWMSTRSPAAISDTMASRILALYAVIVRAHQVLAPANVASWLSGNEPLLGDARPIDVLVLRGPGSVLEALDGIEDGVHA